MNKVWLIGVGAMGMEYAKVLKALDIEYVAIGRSETTAITFERSCQHTVIKGGLEKFLSTKPSFPSAAIVAVNVETLAEVTDQLLNYGVTKILLEKPGFGNPSEIDTTVELARRNNATVLLAYNRRFYSSVFKAEELIKADGGVTSFNFEFTEWSHLIETLDKSPATLSNWLLANSSHVIDTAFFLGGRPRELAPFVKGGVIWHPRSSVFSGAGITDLDALFSYQANWESPGRWSIEICTKKHRLYFKPMESLQIQNIGSIVINPLPINDELDKQFKPGFYLQTKAFLEGDVSRFCTIEDQQHNLKDFYLKIAGYK